MKNDERFKNKEELEAELLKVRSEIQWRERELEEPKDHLYFVSFIVIALFILLGLLFGEEATGLVFIVWIIASIILIVIVQKSFNKSNEGKRIQKATQELEGLKKRKTELEKKIDALEDLEKSEKRKRKGKLSK